MEKSWAWNQYYTLKLPLSGFEIEYVALRVKKHRVLKRLHLFIYEKVDRLFRLMREDLLSPPPGLYGYAHLNMIRIARPQIKEGLEIVFFSVEPSDVFFKGFDEWLSRLDSRQRFQNEKG